jgi:phage host-nuclease inhibitor protein Gam
MDQLASDIARLKNDEAKLCAQRDADVLAVQARFVKPLAAVAEELSDAMARAQAWALANQAEFAKARSIKFTGAEVGFRMGQPQVKPLKGWTFAKVLSAILSLHWRRFVRVKQEVNKDAILAGAKRLGGRLAKIGVEVVQEESFFVDPKGTVVETRETAEVKG